MKQFFTIFKFELKSYLKNKVFMGVTIFLIAVLAVVILLLPTIISLVKPDTSTAQSGVMGVCYADESLSETVTPTLQNALTEYKIVVDDGDRKEIKDKVLSGEYDCAIYLTDLLTYDYYVNDLSLYDQNTMIIDAVLAKIYQLNAMVSGGISPGEAGDIMSATPNANVVTLGKDHSKNFMYTFIMIFALYMVILLYGQLVATNVANEKSSRAMEVLVTSAKPTNMMFGKVFASCTAGLIQLLSIFLSAIIFYNLNKSAWGDNQLIQSFFNIPIDLLGYMVLYFLLGFLIYAFMYGAVGSTANKLEDINTSVMPITFLFIICFFITMFSMQGDQIDSLLMKIASYVPFTSPMAMFTRIAMSNVMWYEILISVLILVGTVIGIGYLSAKIYRVGVLLYGTKIKMTKVLKMIFKKDNN